MLRWILAVITGYLVFAISAALFYQVTGQNPHTVPTILSGIVGVLYGMVIAAMAGFVAARFAPRGKLIASASVGGIIAAGVAVSLIREGPESSLWSQLSLLLLIAPATYVGGILYRKSKGTG